MCVCVCRVQNEQNRDEANSGFCPTAPLCKHVVEEKRRREESLRHVTIDDCVIRQADFSKTDRFRLFSCFLFIKRSK